MLAGNSGPEWPRRPYLNCWYTSSGICNKLKANNRRQSQLPQPPISPIPTHQLSSVPWAKNTMYGGTEAHVDDSTEK